MPPIVIEKSPNIAIPIGYNLKREKFAAQHSVSGKHFNGLITLVDTDIRTSSSGKGGQTLLIESTDNVFTAGDSNGRQNHGLRRSSNSADTHSVVLENVNSSQLYRGVNLSTPKFGNNLINDKLTLKKSMIKRPVIQDLSSQNQNVIVYVK